MAPASSLVLLTALATACGGGSAHPKGPTPAPAAPEPSDAAAEAPAKAPAPAPAQESALRIPADCQGPGHALGPAERERLVALEAQIVEAFFDDAGARWDALQLRDVAQMARKYPTYETVLSLPLPTPLAGNRALRVRRATPPFDGSKTKASVFVLEIRDVEATAAGALRFSFASLPMGPHPAGILWMWGTEGLMCATEAAGRYEIRPAGLVTTAPQ